MPEPDAEEDIEMDMVAARIPKDVKDAAKDKLPHGGMTREIQDLFNRIAYGEDLNFRSRLQRQRRELADRLEAKRRERRELDTDIENMESRIKELDRKMETVTTREDKFEAKLEEIEAKLRIDGMHIDPEHPAVKRAAQTGGVETGKVMRKLRERNPDVPEYAFQEFQESSRKWEGLPQEQAFLPVDERETIPNETN